MRTVARLPTTRARRRGAGDRGVWSRRSRAAPGDRVHVTGVTVPKQMSRPSARGRPGRVKPSSLVADAFAPAEVLARSSMAAADRAYPASPAHAHRFARARAQRRSSNSVGECRTASTGLRRRARRGRLRARSPPCGRVELATRAGDDGSRAVPALARRGFTVHDGPPPPPPPPRPHRRRPHFDDEILDGHPTRPERVGSERACPGQDPVGVERVFTPPARRTPPERLPTKLARCSPHRGGG